MDWQKRLNNYKKALQQLQKGVEYFKNKIHKNEPINDLEKQGLIKSFELCFELSWKLITDYFKYQGIVDIRGSRDAFRVAYKHNIIENQEIWLEMINARNLSVHTYDSQLVEELISNILNNYYQEFFKLL